MKGKLLLLLVCLYTAIGAQPLQQVAHLPSTEGYDMLIDKKGFIWLAHNLGVSRYDGINFTNFSNPAQTSLSMTDLMEDKYGRIWCHSFNSQVFYIKDDKMYWLKEYDYKSETIFPRMILYKDELIITSCHGLFVCDINTLQCKYLEKERDSRISTSSLCVVNDKVLLFGAPVIWGVYTKEKGVERITDTDLPNDEEEVSSALQPRTFNQEAFKISFHSNTVMGLTLDSNNRLRTVYKKSLNAFVNSVGLVHGNPWLHTRTGSYSLDGKDSIIGYNITSGMADKWGNLWFSSLSKGLLVRYKNSGWQRISHEAVPADDYVRFIQQADSSFILCSQYGRILMSSKKSPGKYDLLYTVEPARGTIEGLDRLNDRDFIVEASHCTFTLDEYTRQVKFVLNYNTKGIVVNGSTGYLAMSSSVKVQDVNDWQLHNKSAPLMPYGIHKSLWRVVPNGIFIKGKPRSRGILFDTLNNCLIVSFADGLQRVYKDTITMVLYQGQPLFVSSMVHYGRKIYAATFTNGLFVIDSNKVERVQNNPQSVPDAIIRIKRCRNHIWLFRAHDIEVLNAIDNKFLHIYQLPADAADITDVEEDETNIYLATNTGLYTIPWSFKDEMAKADITLLYVLVNNKDTVYNNSVTLASNRNNIIFKLAIPVYKTAEQLHFKYRLLNGGEGGGDTVWYYTQDAQREIQFNALKPGTYSIEVIAVKDNEVLSNKPLVYQFTINRPWYNAWWFYTAVLLSFISIVLSIYQYRLRQVFKIERIRRKISNDLHDEIGSTLSSINVYSQLAKSDNDNLEYINTIQTNVVSVINNLDDLVWNINPKNDALENMINRMRLFALPIFNEKGIRCIFKVKTDNPQLLVAPNIRADIYMLFKEMVNNVIKHANCTTCSIFIIQRGKRFMLTVNDNGRGFNVKNTNPHRNGLRIMAERAKDVKGNIKIAGNPGAGTRVQVKGRLE